jgi:hypothetical protein
VLISALYSVLSRYFFQVLESEDTEERDKKYGSEASEYVRTFNGE